MKKTGIVFFSLLPPSLRAPGPLPSLARRAAPLPSGPGRAQGAFATVPAWGLQALAIWLKRLETFPLLPCRLCAPGLCVPLPGGGGVGPGAAAAAAGAGGVVATGGAGGQPRRSSLLPVPARPCKSDEFFLYFFFLPRKEGAELRGAGGACSCRGSGRIVEERAGKGLPGRASPPCPPQSIRGAARRRARPASPRPSAGPCPTGHPLPYRDRGELLPRASPAAPLGRSGWRREGPAGSARPARRRGALAFVTARSGMRWRERRIAPPPAAGGSPDPARPALCPRRKCALPGRAARRRAVHPPKREITRLSVPAGSAAAEPRTAAAPGAGGADRRPRLPVPGERRRRAGPGSSSPGATVPVPAGRRGQPGFFVYLVAFKSRAGGGGGVGGVRGPPRDAMRCRAVPAAPCPLPAPFVRGGSRGRSQLLTSAGPARPGAPGVPPPPPLSRPPAALRPAPRPRVRAGRPRLPTFRLREAGPVRAAGGGPPSAEWVSSMRKPVLPKSPWMLLSC